MKIEKDKVVSLIYTLKDSSGGIIDFAEEEAPFLYIHGSDDIVPGLEEALTGKNPQDSFELEIEAENAFGEYYEELVFEVSRERLHGEAEIEEGMEFVAETDHGPALATVVAVDAEKNTATVDLNHPLAGEKLFFSVTVCNVRDATQEELANGLYADCGCGDDDCGGCDCEDICGHHH